MNVKNSSINEVRKEDSEEISNHLANLAAEVPNVNNATAVALGKFAVVGIDVDKDLDRSKVGSIKYSVAEALKRILMVLMRLSLLIRIFLPASMKLEMIFKMEGPFKVS